LKCTYHGVRCRLQGCLFRSACRLQPNIIPPLLADNHEKQKTCFSSIDIRRQCHRPQFQPPILPPLLRTTTSTPKVSMLRVSTVLLSLSVSGDFEALRRSYTVDSILSGFSIGLCSMLFIVLFLITPPKRRRQWILILNVLSSFFLIFYGICDAVINNSFVLGICPTAPQCIFWIQ
jgi:Fungal pheromone mating factor STE2 GPCR